MVVGKVDPETVACEAAASRGEGCAVEGDIDFALLARWEGAVVGLADGCVEEACGSAGSGDGEVEDGLVSHSDCAAESGIAGEGNIVGFTVYPNSKVMAGVGGKCLSV